MTIRADGGRRVGCGRGRSDSLCAYGLPARSLGGRPSRRRQQSESQADRRRSERGRERGAFGSAIVTWYETRPPPSPPEPPPPPPPEGADTTVVDLAFDPKSPPLSFHFHCGSRTVRKQGATHSSLSTSLEKVIDGQITLTARLRASLALTEAGLRLVSRLSSPTTLRSTDR